MNIDTLVESFYRKEEETESLINEVLRLLIVEAKQREITLSWDGIPDIPISEIPWSSVETVAGGADIQGPERQQLMQFLDDIEGEDLQDKVKGLSAFYDADPSALLDKTQGMNAKEKISAALGYLTFFKTLTKIIAHFNASSAGFSFEAFLGVLLGGKQIPASGANTIADLVAKVGDEEVPISLKLYTEGQLKVGGSFTDLVNDLRKYGQMQYVAVTKDLNDEKTSGTLNFYRFNFTLDNIATLMLNGGLHNPEWIRLPSRFAADPKAFADIEIPPPPKAEELLQSYEDTAEELASSAGYPTDAVQRALTLVGLPESMEYMTGTKVFGHPKSELKKIKTGVAGTAATGLAFAKALGLLPEDATIPKAYKRSPDYEAQLQDLEDFKRKVALAVNIYNNIVVKAYAVVIDEANRVRKARQELVSRAGAGSIKDYLSPEDSVAAYNDKDGVLGMTPELKKKALLLTVGYINTEQFEFTESRVLNIKELAQPYPALPAGQEEVKLGSIEVGQEKVINLMQKVSEIIDKSVFLIFEDLKTLTTNIQSYFGNGLQDDKQAHTAIEASRSIGTKTAALTDDDGPQADDGLADEFSLEE